MDLDKKITLEQPSKEVSYAGIKEIHRYINKELDLLCFFPCGWSWDWVHTDGEYRGKLPNRIAGRIKSYYGLKLTPEQRSVIGNIARKHLLVEEEYTIDFTEYFDWDVGDFGDRGSCFWGENSGARGVMEEEGVIAIRFYDALGYSGIGRAWLYELSDDAWILFNAYGLECPEAASILAMSLEEDTDDTWEYEQMDAFRINGITRGFVYINNCPQIVYRKGYDRELSVDLDWDIPYSVCAKCGDWTHYDDLYYDEQEDESLCKGCYEMLQDKKEGERLTELEELEEAEFVDNAARTEIAHIFAQEAIRFNIAAQVTAGQLNLGVEYQVNLFYG